MPKPKSMNKSPEKRGIDPFLQACTKSPRVFMKFLEVKRSFYQISKVGQLCANVEFS